jgi:hypothetical protein
VIAGLGIAGLSLGNEAGSALGLPGNLWAGSASLSEWKIIPLSLCNIEILSCPLGHLANTLSSSLTVFAIVLRLLQ